MREKLGHRTRGAKTQQNSLGAWHYSPLPEGVSSHRGTTEGGGKRVGTKAEAQEEDEHPGGGRLTETREVTKEGGAREETGGTRSRRRTAGPRPQPWWWPAVEPTEGGAMEEWLPPTPGGRPTAAEQVVEEPEAETESQRARGMQRIRGARVEPRALATEAKVEIWRSTAEPERLRTQVELKGGRSPTEPVGRSDEAQPEERSPEAMAGRCPTKAEPEGRGSPVELEDRWMTVEGYSSPGDAGGWQTHGARTVQQGAEGERRGCQTTAVEEAGAGGRAGIFEEWALEDLTPPPCPAHPQPRCRGRSSTPCSHRPRLAPSWWALSPALAPGLTGWAQLPGRSSAQSLGLALARRSRREMALRHRWAWAGAPWAGLWVRSGSGEIIHCADGEGRSVTRQSPLYEGGEILSRTIFGRQRSASGIQARIIEWAERVVRVAGGVSYTQEQSSMVLERSVPLLQQEEKEFGPDEGIHGDTRRKQKTEKKR